MPVNTTASPQTTLISVVICTRNRAALLGKALESVVTQDFPKTDYEIVIVDNGSTDSTSECAAEFKEKAMVHYIREPHAGLCIARNTGWRNASGRYVAFFDDDALALPGWLAAVRNGFELDTARDIGVIGGRVKPMWEQPRPGWLADPIANSLTIVDWGPSPKRIHDIRSEWLVGTNMAVPKRLLTEVGGFHPALDRIGNNLLSNGDILLQKELMRRGHSCWYVPDMAVNHLVPASRLTQAWFRRRFFWQGVSDAVMQIIEKKPSAAQRIKFALVRSMVMMSAPLTLASLLGPTTRPEQFTAKCLALVEIGFLAGILGIVRG